MNETINVDSFCLEISYKLCIQKTEEQGNNIKTHLRKVRLRIRLDRNGSGVFSRMFSIIGAELFSSDTIMLVSITTTIICSFVNIS